MGALPTPIPGFAGAYIAHGWKLCAIPEGIKSPVTAGWNRAENALTEAPPSGGVGLLHAYSGTCSIDIDDLTKASCWFAERGIDLQAMVTAPDSVQINSGQPNRGKLLFALPFPMQTKKILDGDQTVLEFRCAAGNGTSVQDVLPPSRHPSGTFYQWAGRGKWEHLPLLPDDVAVEWTKLLEDDSKRSIQTGDNATPASLEEVRSALFAVNSSCDRKTWVELGMALATISDETFDLWNEWSQQSEKYPGISAMRTQWKSFRPVQQGITVRTLFHHAQHAGWKRPTPDVSHLFGPVESKDEKPVIRKIADEMSMVSPIPECDFDLFPPLLVSRAKEIAKEVGCDPVVPLLAGLCAVSAAVDKRTRLSITPTWRVPPTIWAMTIGEPADKKTPGSKPMFAPLYKLEAEDRPRFEMEMLKWKGIEARHAGDMKAFREWQQSPEAAMPGAVPPDVTPLPPMPSNVRLLVSDATSQKLVTMAESRPRGFLLYLDEMNRWLTKLGDPRSSDDRGAWIQGYESGPYSMDRVGAGSIKVENLSMSIYGNCQPAVFRSTVVAASSDGISQRFLPVVLNPTHNAVWGDPVPSFMSFESSYEQLIRRCFTMPAFDYTLSAESNALLRGFSERCISLRKAEQYFNRSQHYQTALGKMEGNCARLILLFQLTDDPYSTEIGVDVASRAIAAFESFFVPNMRFTYLEVGQQRDDMPEDILHVLVQWASARAVITLSDIRRALRSDGKAKYLPTVQDQMIRIYMDEFASMGYVAMFQDHPRFPVWTINPALADLFAEERKAIIDRKKENVERLKENTGNHSVRVIGS